ncbi:hypothetical protein [Achromobacter aloeverae]
MTHQWQKLGRIYCPSDSGRHEKLLTHAANPLPVHLHGDVYRVFYCGRDLHNKSSVGAVDINVITRKVTAEHYAPLFEYGPQGSFYGDGVSIGSHYSIADGTRYIFFMGWQTKAPGDFRGDIGRLVLCPNFTLRLDSDKPILPSDHTDPLSLSYPCVLRAEDGSYLMWYGSTVSWDAGNGEMLHIIKYATSIDGHDWIRYGQAVPFEMGTAQAFSRPTVVRDERGNYQMWFSYRGNTDKYRIGYATSENGRDWRLALAESGIDVSSTGWDSEMIEYPYVFDHNGKRYMLYNGNGYGRTGFGLAELHGTQ